MTRPSKRSKLRRLTKETEVLRRELGVSAPNTLLYRKRRSALKSPVVLVEADGIGGAWTSMIEGNYPFDYLVLYEKHFRQEVAAIRAASDVVELNADPELIL